MAITELPPAPSRSDEPAVFIAKADAFVAALAQMVAEINATAAGFDVTLWVSGTTYALYDMVYSPITLLTYRRAVAGAGTTDPSADTVNWTVISTALPSGSNGQVLTKDSSQTLGTIYIDNPSRSNLLINPNWQIDQINAGALYTYSAATAVGPDGWTGSATGAGIFKLRTIADPDNAALKCLEITCTTADASIAAGDDYFITSAIEGYDAAGLQAGTASAQPITVQFKFKSNVTGVYGVSIANSAGNRRYIGIITVPDANENEYSLSLTMDAAGTWLYTNGVGLSLRLCLAAGSTFQGAAGAWAAGAEQTTVAQCNFMSVNTNVAYLKRIQLIPGALVQAYKPADIPGELARCQRYYEKTFETGTAVANNVGIDTGDFHWIGVNALAQSGAQWQYKVNKRASPTVTLYNPAANNAQARDRTAAADCTSSASSFGGQNGVLITGIQTAGGIQGGVISVHLSANARLS